MRRLLMLSLALAGLVAAAATVSPVKASIPHCPWAMGPAASGPRPKPVGTITIGSIGLRTKLYQGESFKGMANATDAGLTYGPAMYPKSKFFGNRPWQGKTIGIAGHRTTRLHPFCLLNTVKPGQYVTLTFGKWIYAYRVVCVKLRANPKTWKNFQHPQRCSPARKLQNAARRTKYLVLGACTPPRQAIYRINVVARYVGARLRPRYGKSARRK
jgi:sortase (surface protein transpeptidase)